MQPQMGGMPGMPPQPMGGGISGAQFGGDPFGAPASQAPEPEGPDPFAALGRHRYQRSERAPQSLLLPHRLRSQGVLEWLAAQGCLE